MPATLPLVQSLLSSVRLPELLGLVAPASGRSPTSTTSTTSEESSMSKELLNNARTALITAMLALEKFTEVGQLPEIQWTEIHPSKMLLELSLDKLKKVVRNEAPVRPPAPANAPEPVAPTTPEPE